MTQSEARRILRDLGWTLRCSDGEYRVAPRGASEDRAYYTNDLDDAIGTARAENARQQAR